MITSSLFLVPLICLSLFWPITVADIYPNTPTSTNCTLQPECRETQDLSNRNLTKYDNISYPDTNDRRTNSTTFDARNHPNYHLLPNLTECGISASAVKTPNYKRFKRVTNGKPAGFGKYLMVAQIMGNNVSTDGDYRRCIGTLINARYVLTSAYCASRLPTGTVISGVKLGRYDMTDEFECTPYYFDNYKCNLEIIRGVEEIIVHDDFNWFTYENDIALIRLNEAVNFTDFVKPACLPYTEEMMKNLEGQTVSVAGWGYISSYEDNTEVRADKLSEINMTIVTNEYCEIFSTFFSGKLGPRRICGLGKNQMDLCIGDLGAPMFKIISVSNGIETRQFQIGVFSSTPTKFGANCGRQGVPEMFMNVFHYMPWILDNLKP